MDCNTLKEHLYKYIDKEVDAATHKLIEKYLHDCPLCAMYVDYERRIDCLIRTHFPPEQAPYQLREGIITQIKKVKEMSEEAGF